MALVIVKNALVEKAFNGGRGYAVSETFKKRDGTDGKSRMKVWFDEPTSLTEGSRVDLSGILSTKVAEFEGNDGLVQYAEVSLNSARLNSGSSSSEPTSDDDPAF